MPLCARSNANQFNSIDSIDLSIAYVRVLRRHVYVSGFFVVLLIGRRMKLNCQTPDS